MSNIHYYQGADALPGIKFHKASEELGVNLWDHQISMNIVEIDAGCMNYPEYNHKMNGLEEVFVILKGDGQLETGNERFDLREGSILKVGPEVRRKVIPGEVGITILTFTGCPANVKV